MTNELALKLKNAWFPYTRVKPYFKEDKFIGNIPDISLSELIEACGERGMFTLTREQGEDGWVWTATTPHLTMRELVSETGSNQEEAVANLWLALNKK